MTINLAAIRAKVEARRLSAPSRRRLRPEERDCDRLLQAYDELREAAGKVTCATCDGEGKLDDGEWMPCPDCDDLRALLGGE